MSISQREIIANWYHRLFDSRTSEHSFGHLNITNEEKMKTIAQSFSHRLLLPLNLFLPLIISSRLYLYDLFYVCSSSPSSVLLPIAERFNLFLFDTYFDELRFYVHLVFISFIPFRCWIKIVNAHETNSNFSRRFSIEIMISLLSTVEERADRMFFFVANEIQIYFRFAPSTDSSAASTADEPNFYSFSDGKFAVGLSWNAKK